MTSCAICTRHPHSPDQDCTGGCWQPQPKTGRLCTPCTVQLRNDIDDIKAARQALGIIPGIATTGRSAGNERGLPGGTERLDYLHGPQLKTALFTIVDRVAEDSGLPSPTRDAIGWLRTHIDHVAAHPAIAQFARELHTWANLGKRLAGMTEQGQHVPCPTITVDGPCGRRLLIDVHQPDATVACTACGRAWAARDLLAMGTRDSIDVWLDPDSMQIPTGVPDATLRRWARRGLVRRRHGLYHLGDVIAAQQSEQTRYRRRILVATATGSAT